MRMAAIVAAMLACPLSALPAPAAAQAPAKARAHIPRPRLAYAGTELYSTASGAWRRYRLSVANRAAFPAALFTPSPGLPPCGTNANSARSWIDIYDGDGTRLYGFCAIDKPADLEKLWFAVRSDATPPASVYIELLDRLTGERYRSNKVAIPRPAPAPTPGGAARQPGRAQEG